MIAERERINRNGQLIACGGQGRVKVKFKMSSLGDLENDWGDKAQGVKR